MRHLDQKHLAERWLISPRTLEQWRWQGRGPRYLKIGGRVVYRLSDIEAFESVRAHTNTIGPVIRGSKRSRPMATAETIAKALGGRKAGGGWTARCRRMTTARRASPSAKPTTLGSYVAFEQPEARPS